MGNSHIYKKFLKKIKLASLEKIPSEKRLKKIREHVFSIAEEEKLILCQQEIDHISKSIYEDSFEFGPISLLVKDEKITEIMINDFNEVYVEKEGRIRKTGICFRSIKHLKNLIDKILSPLGLRVDESSPMVDARLSNGSRINVVINPISTKDMVVTIRKFRETLMKMEDLIELGMLDNKIYKFLRRCVEKKLNIMVTGGTSTGKTTLLNVLSNFIKENERIITIEDTLELNLSLPHVIRLESRPPNIEGKGEISIRNLVKNSLRMRPDRIIIGEIRGLEAIDVLQAMNTGHSGSMSTLHANSPQDLVSRLETLLLMAGLNLNPDTAKRIQASSLDLVIHLEKLENGQKVISKISEIVSGDGKNLQVRDLYKFYRGKFTHTGYEPNFFNKLDR